MLIGLQYLIIRRGITKLFNSESYFKENFQSFCNPINILGPYNSYVVGKKLRSTYQYILFNLMPYVQVPSKSGAAGWIASHWELGQTGIIAGVKWQCYAIGPTDLRKSTATAGLPTWCRFYAATERALSVWY